MDYSKLNYDELLSCKTDLGRMYKNSFHDAMKNAYDNRIQQISHFIKMVRR